MTRRKAAKAVSTRRAIAVERGLRTLDMIAKNPEVGKHAVVRENVLPILDGLGTTQRNEKIARGEYPPPFSISESGRAKAWFLHEILAWQAERKRLRDERLKAKVGAA